MKEYKYLPEIGKKYGQWEVISTEIKSGSLVKGSSDRTSYWKVICKCGRETWRSSNALVYNKTNSCKSCCKTINEQNTYILSYLRKVKNRAETSKFEFNIDANYIEQLYINQNKKCVLSGLDIIFRPNYMVSEQTASLDRIDNTKGYIQGNVQWLHKDVNNMKHTFTQKYFIQLCKSIAVNN